MNTDTEPVECSSEEGITIGLIDTIITAAQTLKGRQVMFDHPAVKEALKDFYCCEELRALLLHAAGFDYKKVKLCYEVDALERAMVDERKAP